MPGHDGGGPLGAQGELVATDTLRRQGYRILERNYRCPLGELDVVARKGKTLVFVEVKSGLDERIPPRDRVDARKKRKLSQVATFYLKEHGLEGVSARFDVVEVSFPVDGGTPRVELIPNAFDLDGT